MQIPTIVAVLFPPFIPQTPPYPDDEGNHQISKRRTTLFYSSSSTRGGRLDFLFFSVGIK